MNSSFIGIDLGGTRIKIGLVSGNNVLENKLIAANPLGLESNLEGVRSEIDNLMHRSHGFELKGIGFGFPGLVDPVAKKILSTNKKYDDALTVDLSTWVKKNWDVPLYLDNDARMAAIGEWKSGAATDTDNFISVTLGTGVGTAVVMDGKLLRGKHFQAGCLGGHFAVNYLGRICTCGNIGCLEAYASTWSIKERVIADQRYKTSLLSSTPVIDFENLFTAAKQNDPLAMDMKQDCFDAWSSGIISLIHAYDPDTVILGGGAMNNYEEILPYLTSKIHKYAWTPWGKVAVRPSLLMSNAGVIGAAYAAQYQL